MLGWMSRHRILTWSIAWAVTAAGFGAADVFSMPRNGPLWAGVAFGLVGWTVAGAVTLCRSRLAGGVAIWASAYLVAVWLGATWRDGMVEHRSGAGFMGMLYGWAVGGGAGALASACLMGRTWNPARPILLGGTWALSFFAAGYLAVVIWYLAGALVPDPMLPAIPVVAGACGGAAAAALGLAAWRVFILSAPRPIGSGWLPLLR
jgi:hypothetical protein